MTQRDLMHDFTVIAVAIALDIALFAAAITALHLCDQSIAAGRRSALLWQTTGTLLITFAAAVAVVAVGVATGSFQPARDVLLVWAATAANGAISVRSYRMRLARARV